MNEDKTMCGYDEKELKAFAVACRNAGVTENELHAFVCDMKNAYDCVYAEMRQIIQEQIDSIRNSMVEKEIRG